MQIINLSYWLNYNCSILDDMKMGLLNTRRTNLCFKDETIWCLVGFQHINIKKEPKTSVDPKCQ